MESFWGYLKIGLYCFFVLHYLGLLSYKRTEGVYHKNLAAALKLENDRLIVENEGLKIKCLLVEEMEVVLRPSGYKLVFGDTVISFDEHGRFVGLNNVTALLEPKRER